MLIQTGKNIPIHQVDIPQAGCLVHLKGYGMIKVFKIVKTDADIKYWASSDLSISDLIRLKYAEFFWMIETYRRGVKQFCEFERCQGFSPHRVPLLCQRNFLV